MRFVYLRAVYSRLIISLRPFSHDRERMSSVLLSVDYSHIPET